VERYRSVVLSRSEVCVLILCIREKERKYYLSISLPPDIDSSVMMSIPRFALLLVCYGGKIYHKHHQE